MVEVNEVKIKKATNVQFNESQMLEINECMSKLGFTTIADFVKFSCKQMCNLVETHGGIAFSNGKKKVVARKVD